MENREQGSQSVPPGQTLYTDSGGSSISSSSIDSAIARLQSTYRNAPRPHCFSVNLSSPTVKQDLEKLFEQVVQGGPYPYTAGDKLATIRVEITKLKVPGDIKSMEVLDRKVADSWGMRTLDPAAGSY